MYDEIVETVAAGVPDGDFPADFEEASGQLERKGQLESELQQIGAEISWWDRLNIFTTTRAESKYAELEREVNTVANSRTAGEASMRQLKLGIGPLGRWAMAIRGAFAFGVVLGFLCLAVGGAVAADAGDPGETVSGGTADAGTAASGESPVPKRDAGSAGTEQPDTAAGGNPAREVFRRYDLAGDPTAVQSLEAARTTLQRWIDHWSEKRKDSEANAENFDTAAKSLVRQLENPALPESAGAPLRRETARTAARGVFSRARGAALGAIVERAAPDLETLESTSKRVRSRSRASGDDERQSVEKAKAAEKRALEELEESRARAEQERDVDLRRLMTQRSDVLSKVAKVAGEQRKAIRRLQNERREISDSFARRQEKIEREIAQIPEDPSDDEARQLVDPVFRTIREYRREARSDYAAALEELRAAIGDKRVARDRYEEAVRARDRVETRAERLADSRLTEQKVALAEAKAKLQSRELDKAQSVVDAREAALELHAERIRYFTDRLEGVLPRISDATRDEFFAIWKTESWQNVAASFGEARRSISRLMELRTAQLQSLGDRIYSAELWGWVLGLLWRLALVPLTFVFLRRYSPSATRRFVNFLLHRSFFRRRAAGTIKFGELLRTLVWPATLFAVAHLVVGYLSATFPELEVLLWVLDIVFIYWLVMATVEVLILPRAHRDAEGRTAPELDFGRLSPKSSAHREEHVVDIVDLGDERAIKLVSTCRRLLTFALAAWFVPHVVAKAFGHTVLWWLVGAGFQWAIVVVVYYELSTWRDEIAGLFDELAGERLPKVTAFVQEQKDRFYGVLIIALASVYVVAAEIWEFARRSFTETELAQRLANFLFRKKIELKQREEREEAAVDQARHEELPADYLELFEDRPLYDEEYLVERKDVREQLVEPWDQWRERPRQGSMAVIGEQGMGKSTLLNGLYRHLIEEQAETGIDPLFAALTDKIVTIDALIAYLADLFGLEELPQDRSELVDQLLDTERRVVLMDDCHHLFFRKIQGFEALSAFLDIVNLTDHHHFWVLTFNEYGWKYLRRVQERKHFFGYTLNLPEWSPSELQAMVERRNDRRAYAISFSDLVVTRGEEAENYYEVVKTANGYFRLLQEFSKGNPRVALDFWVRNLIPEPDGTFRVSLFRQPSLDEFSTLTDNHLFALTAIVQHGALTPEETADIINAERGFCEMALDFFEDAEIATRKPGTGRYRLTSYFYRPVVSRLINSNFLWN